jgi:hypothetical protein
MVDKQIQAIMDRIASIQQSKPEADAVTIANMLWEENSNVEHFIMEVRRNVRLHRIGEYADIPLGTIEHLAPIADQFEKLMKARKEHRR